MPTPMMRYLTLIKVEILIIPGGTVLQQVSHRELELGGQFRAGSINFVIVHINFTVCIFFFLELFIDVAKLLFRKDMPCYTIYSIAVENSSDSCHQSIRENDPSISYSIMTAVSFSL